MSRGGDRWLEEYNSALDIAEDVESSIQERNQLEQSGQSSAKVTSQIRRFLNELALAVQTLEDLVNSAHKQYHITDDEYNTRLNQVNELKARRDDLQHTFSVDPMGSGSGYTNPGYTGGGGYNDEEFMRQQQIMREQDSGLDILQQSIQRQKEMGMAIGTELDDHNVMLDDLNERMENTDGQLLVRTNQVIRVTEKAKGQGLCCCAALLVIAIVIVASIKT